MKKNRSTLFWIGYTDIMISLFFVMLLLFVFTFFQLQTRNTKLEKKVETLDFLKQVEANMEALSDGELFEYVPELKKHVLKERVRFASMSARIPKSAEAVLIKAGYRVKNLITDLQDSETNNKQKINYLIILEGMASKDSFIGNYELSYKRAKSVFDFWKRNKITFDPENVEVIISGSGTEGSIRSDKEYLNRSIMIQIIPKNIPEYM